jgi:predicted tellurium resistance membrane protein TerC
MFVILEMISSFFQIGFAFSWSLVKLFLPAKKKEIKDEMALVRKTYKMRKCKKKTKNINLFFSSHR